MRRLRLSPKRAARRRLPGLPRMNAYSSQQFVKRARRPSQVERIDQVVELLGIRLKRIKCAAMEGLFEEGKEVIDSVEEGPLRDAALIGGAQKVEHYEIAAYGTLCALARQLGYRDALPLLEATLEEEKATDRKLTLLAEGGGNQRAAAQAA